MKLEEQVCNLELAKKLKEFGVKQESYFQWREGGVLGGQRPQTSEILPTKRPPTFGAANEAHSSYSAFTVAELGEMLPVPYATHYNPSDNKWWCNDSDSSPIHQTYANTEADARAKMLIYLLENKLINPHQEIK